MMNCVNFMGLVGMLTIDVDNVRLWRREQSHNWLVNDIHGIVTMSNDYIVLTTWRTILVAGETRPHV